MRAISLHQKIPREKIHCTQKFRQIDEFFESIKNCFLIFYIVNHVTIEIVKFLIANAKANEKSRPQMAYYALKEALSLVGDNPKMVKNINLKMKY